MSAAAVFVALVARNTKAAGTVGRPDWAAIRRLGRVGGDLLARTLALRGALTLATAVATRVGAADVAAQEVAFAVWSLLALALDAIAIAGQALIGRFLGAGEAAVAHDAGRRMLRWGLGAGVVLGAVLFAVRPIVVPLFTSDQRVIELASTILVVVAVMQPLNALVFVLDGLLIGAGDLRYLAVAMAGSSVVFVPLAIGVLLSGRGLLALWGALCVLMVTRLGALVVRWQSGRWAVVGASP